MEYHEAACIFPMLEKDKLQELADDIKEHGLMCPIEVYDGQIIDGRNRWEACKLAGVKPGTVQVATDDPVSYVLSLNLKRRHLTKSQRAAAAVKAKDLYEKAAKTRKKTSNANRVNLPTSEKGRARDKVGAAFEVSGEMVERAEKVAKNGTASLNKAVEDGKLTVNAALQVVDEPTEVQDKIAKSDNPKQEVKKRTQPKVKDWVFVKKRAYNSLAAFVNEIDKLQTMKRKPSLHKELVEGAQALMMRLEDRWK